MDNPQQASVIPKMDPRLFRNFTPHTISDTRLLETKHLPMLKEIYAGKTKGKSGGIYRSFVGMPYEDKCFPDPDFLNKLNIFKSLVVTNFVGFFSKGMLLPLIGFIITPKKLKLQTTNKILEHFVLTADRTLVVDLQECSYSLYFVDKDNYCDFGRELMKFITIFLTEWGINPEYAERFAEIICVFVEYDNFYRLVMEDVFSETSKERIMNRKELKRLGELFAKRNKVLAVGPKMQAIVNLISIGLYLPSVRKAFKKALKEIDFTKLQLDEADRYFCLPWQIYDFFGESTEERKAKYFEIHSKIGFPPMLVQKT